MVEPGDVVLEDLLRTGTVLGLLRTGHRPPSSSLLHIFLHFLEISFKFCPSVLEPRYHLIKKPDELWWCVDITSLGDIITIYTAGGWPETHLSSRESQCGGDLVSVRWRQILLVKESLFKLKYLMVGEGCSGFSLLLAADLLPQLEFVCKGVI